MTEEEFKNFSAPIGTRTTYEEYNARYTPKTDQDNGRNNSRRNYEEFERNQKKKPQEQSTLENVRAREDSILRKLRKRTRARQIKQYAEMKMIKGHSEEQAKMAEEQITTKEW